MDLLQVDKCLVCQIEFDKADIIVTNNNCDCNTKFHKDCYEKYIKYEKENNNNELYCTICRNKSSLISKESIVVIDVNSDYVVVKESNPCVKRIKKFIFINFYPFIIKFVKNIKNFLLCKKQKQDLSNFVNQNEISCCCICFWIKGIFSVITSVIGLFLIGFICNLLLCTNLGTPHNCIVCVVSSIISGFSALFMMLVIYGSIKEEYVQRVYGVYSLLNSINFVTAAITDEKCQIKYGLYFLVFLMFFVCYGFMNTIDIRNCDK